MSSSKTSASLRSSEFRRLILLFAVFTSAFPCWAIWNVSVNGPKLTAVMDGRIQDTVIKRLEADRTKPGSTAARLATCGTGSFQALSFPLVDLDPSPVKPSETGTARVIVGRSGCASDVVVDAAVTVAKRFSAFGGTGTVVRVDSYKASLLPRRTS